MDKEHWRNKESEDLGAHRIRVLDGTVATATFSLPKPNCVIVASRRKYHRRLGHINLLLINTNTNGPIIKHKYKPKKNNQQ